MAALENLLKAGTDVNYCDLLRDTALYWTASYDRVECINKLCEYKAIIDYTDIDGDTPLNCAGRTMFEKFQFTSAYFGKTASMEALHKYGAAIDIQNHYNRTAFSFTISQQHLPSNLT